jgi:glutathione S-transferase
MSQNTLYGFAPSTFTRTARLAFEEKGVSYRLAPLAFKEPAHFALHPYGKMPVLEAGPLRLFETLAITTWVDEAHDGPHLQPVDVTARACMLQWVSVACDDLYAPVVKAFFAGDDVSAEAVTGACTALAPLERALTDSRWLASDDTPTLADLFVAPMFAFAHAKVGPTLVNDLPQMARWLSEMQARPSFRATEAT